MNPGDHVRVKVKEYNWHGNGAVGEIDEMDPAYGAHLKFANGHTAYFNLEDIILVSAGTPISACPPDSKCRQK